MKRRHLGWLAAAFGLAFGLLIVAGPAGHAIDWWDWRGPTQNGFSPETGLPSSWSPDTTPTPCCST